MITRTKPDALLMDAAGTPLSEHRTISEAMEAASQIGIGTYTLIQPDITIKVEQPNWAAPIEPDLPDEPVDPNPEPNPDPVEPVPEPDPVDPPPPVSGDSKQFQTFDGESGSTWWYWSRHLGMRWKKSGGDFVDREGTPYGDKPFNAFRISEAGWLELDVTELAKDEGFKGFYLRNLGNTGIARFDGRVSDHPPSLIVDDVPVACLATALIDKSTSFGNDTSDRFEVSRDRRALIQFEVPETLEKATLRLYVNRMSSGGTGKYELYRLNPPAFTFGGNEIQEGVATEADIIERIDWNKQSIARGNPGHEVLDDGRTLRHSFAVGDPDKRLSLWSKDKLMLADLTDSLRPPDRVVEEAFVKMEVLLEDDWTSTRDGNKGGISWDLRMGWWVDTDSGGYWQSTTGNGGLPGTGLRKIAPAGRHGSRQTEDRNVYEGHSIRMEFGHAQGDGNPYDHLRPLQSYTYHLDQSGNYGDMIRLGNGVVQPGKWFTIEQRIKMNSIVGPFDALGNGIAVNDGVLETWLNGTLIHSRRNMAWRRHPDMGVEGIWHNWFYGGKRATEVEMHYQIRDAVIATEYIGVDGVEG